MPRSTRNFWLEADIDGRSTTLEGGPVSRDGGFSLTIYIRDNGNILRAVKVTGHAKSDGTLEINTDAAGDISHSMTGNVEHGSCGFTITTESGRPTRQRPRMVTRDEVTNSALTEWERELSDRIAPESEAAPAPESEAAPAPFGRDPFGHPY